MTFYPTNPSQHQPKYFTQYKLKQVDSETYKVCWLDKKVNTGAIITLKDDDRRYKVIERYGDIESDKLDLNRKPVWYSI